MAESTSTARRPDEEFLRMTADVVAAYVRKNTLPAAQITDIIAAVYRSLRSIEGKGGEAQRRAP